MLDVHPPHESVHSWKDFFIHIATITVGLLIAVCLEQAVETLHHHREADDLRAALNREGDQVINETKLTDVWLTSILAQSQDAEARISTAMHDHKPLQPPTKQKSAAVAAIPDIPILKSAKANGRLTLLTDEEVVIYGELDFGMTKLSNAFDKMNDAQTAIVILGRELQMDANKGESPFAHASDEQLKRYRSALLNFELAASDCRTFARQNRGATEAIRSGERDLTKIQEAELKYNSLP